MALIGCGVAAGARAASPDDAPGQPPATDQGTNASAGQTQPEAGSAPDALLGNLSLSLDIIDRGLSGTLTRREIDGIRQQLDFIIDSARRVRTKARRRAEEIRRLLGALGGKPAESEPPESRQVSRERARLEEQVAESDGRIKSANVILARADGLRGHLAREEFGVLARILGQRSETPLTPGLLGRALSELPNQWQAFSDRLGDWWRNIEFDRQRFGTLMWWLVLLVVVIAVVLPTRNWVLHRYGPDHRDESPSYTRRFRVMLALSLGKVVLPLCSVAGLYVVLLKSAALTYQVDHMAWLFMITLCQYFLVTGLAAAALSPQHPNWRISSFTTDSSVRLYGSIRLFAIALVVFNLASIPLIEPEYSVEIREFLFLDLTQGALYTLFGALVAVAVALAMLNILRKRNWRFSGVDGDGGEQVSAPGRPVRVFYTLARLGLVAGIIATLSGYVNLGMFLSQRIAWTLLLVGVAVLLRAFIAATCRQATVRDSDIGFLLRDKLGCSKRAAVSIMFWVMLSVDLALSAAVVILLLLLWGVQSTDVFSTAASLVYGIKIGSYTLSLVDLGTALVLFGVLFIGVRLFQGFLSNRVLAQTVPDVGVRDALTTGIGYVGVIVALFIAISSLGLELSQLAIIFGALSVGIGFGLQNVVNNFVSGLILLMQRPIKAGDWIVVGQHEGYVKKVNVVSTEIQTFDNAEVIVPNSQLVSSEVMNWTHKSTVARVIVAVRTAHDSDPDQVRNVLLECAAGHDDILGMPAPVVVFRDFDDGALVFELRFFIRQADYMLVIASDIRFALVAAFRAAGIVIPHPQRDIHFGTRGAEAGAAAGTARTAAPDRATDAARDSQADDGDGGE